MSEVSLHRWQSEKERESDRKGALEKVLRIIDGARFDDTRYYFVPPIRPSYPCAFISHNVSIEWPEKFNSPTKSSTYCFD
jgi:hypothetical protein